jgi:bifunctional oligoribonuclease and PAP phosphatase NrnA
MKAYFTKEKHKLDLYSEWTKNAKNIVITSHQNPDGDAFGSALGLWNYLKKFDFENLTFISPTDYADFIAWMPGVSDIVVYDNKNKTLANELIDQADLIFCCDFSSGSRMKDMKDQVLNANAKKVVIDHHEQPESFGDLMYWNEHASSTCELIYQMIVDLGHENLIDIDIATCLYTGLLTDTGSFKYPATTPEVHTIAGKLLEKGVIPSAIHRNLFDQNDFEKLQFLGYVLSKKMTFLPDYRVCYTVISEKELKKYNSKNGDTEGIVNYGLSVAGCVMSAIFIEKEGLIKISFRSVHDFSVADLARDYFEGGGHKNAAGGRSSLSLEETVQKFLTLLPYLKSQLELQPN